VQLNYSGKWLKAEKAAWTSSYLDDPGGGDFLRISESVNGSAWQEIGRIRQPARNLDHGHLLEWSGCAIFLVCRSVRYGESYQIQVYRSVNGGKDWAFWSIVYEKNGAPGSLTEDCHAFAPLAVRCQHNEIEVDYRHWKHNDPEMTRCRISADGGLTWIDTNGG
jgi:hypothetical protein